MANDKQFKTVDEQIMLLKSRKLQFKDEAKAKAILEKSITLILSTEPKIFC